MKAPTGEHKHVPAMKDMSLRDWFAGQALAGILAVDYKTEKGEYDLEYVAEDCYLYADAMMKERAK